MCDCQGGSGVTSGGGGPATAFSCLWKAYIETILATSSYQYCLSHTQNPAQCEATLNAELARIAAELAVCLIRELGSPMP